MKWLRPILFTLLGILLALPLRALLQSPSLFPAWGLWLLAGAVAGLLAALYARPVRGWNWLWRPLAVGLGYAASALILLVLLRPVPGWLSAVLTRADGAPPGARTVPVVVASFSSATQTDTHTAAQVVIAIAALFLVGAAFCLLPGHRQHPNE